MSTLQARCEVSLQVTWAEINTLPLAPFSEEFDTQGAEFILGNMKIYLHILSFLQIEMA